jgi:hypothetical protein
VRIKVALETNPRQMFAAFPMLIGTSARRSSA